MTTVETPPVVDAERSQAPAAQRWFGTGHSANSDAGVAGAQATSAALQGRRASLVVVFCPATIDLVAMIEGVRAEAGDVPLIGCTGLSQYAMDEPVGPAVVVSALGGEGFEIRTTVARNVSADQRAAGEHAAEAVQTLTKKHKMLLLLCDGLVGEQHEVVRGAYSVLGATVPLAGGCAADDLTYERTSQFFSDADGIHVLSDAVVAAAIGSDGPIGIGVAHGWRKGEDIRVIHAGNPDDGSITSLAGVPQGALLWMMETDQEGLVSSVDHAYDESLASLDGLPPLGFLAFDCGVRYLFLGPEGLSQERDRLADRAAGVPLAGFYTYGEIARTRGAQGMHHLTLVIVAFA